MKKHGPMSRKNHILSLLAVLLLLAATAWFLFRGNPLSELWPLLSKTDGRFLLLGLLCLGVFFTMEALGIRTLLRSFGHPVTVMRSYGYALVDFYFSAITPGCCGGQPSQIYYMQRDGIPPGVSSLALLLFNLMYHLAVLIVATAVLLGGGAELLMALGSLKYLLFLGAGVQLALVVLFSLAVFSPRLAPALVRSTVRLLGKIRLVKEPEQWREKAERQIGEYRRGAVHIRRHPGVLMAVLGMALLHILALYVLPYCVYRAFGLTAHGPIYLLAVQAALTLSLESLPIPGGIGVTEASFLVVYGAIFGAELVLPALLLCRGLNYYCGLAAGGLAATVLQISGGADFGNKFRRPCQVHCEKL